MEQILAWSAQLADVTLATATQFINYIPQVLGVIGFLLAGWLIARIGKALVVRLIRLLNRIRPRTKIAGSAVFPKINDSLAQVIARIVFWVVILIFVALSTELLGLVLFADWLTGLVNYLPKILSGALIIWAGIVFSGLTAQAISTAAVHLQESQRAALSRIAQVFILVVLILIGVDQIGVDITLVTTILSVTFGAVLGGLAIAFSLGARHLVSNLIGARYLNPDYRIGRRIKVDDHEGTILEINSVSVILETNQGRVTIPARLFSELPSVLVAEDPKNV